MRLKTLGARGGDQLDKYIGKTQLLEEYVYSCNCSNLKKTNTTEELDIIELHENYKQRSTSETWISEVK